jgi:acyl-lipid omega-6 desaturase (Delta-12 desaturase)
MTKEQYSKVRSGLSFERSFAVTLLVIAGDLALFAAAVYGLSFEWGSPMYWAAHLILAVVYFHNFALLHEAGHGNIHANERVNALVGHYASLFCFLPYYPWKYIHHEHHTWTGNLERDPTLYQVKKMRHEGRVPWIARFAWRSWIPFGGLLQHTVFWLYPFRSWRDGRFQPVQKRNSLLSVLFLGGAYGLLALYGPAWFSFARLWPSLVIYLIGVEIVNFPHHIDMPVATDPNVKLAPWEQPVTTRSCDYGLLAGVLVLNFNLHTEHHLYPTLPWYRLTAARDRVRALLAGEYNEVKGIRWNIENRGRDPREIMLREKSLPLPAAVGESKRDAA